MIYSIVKFILKFAFKILFRWEIYGRENLPMSSGAILAANHTSFLDPLLIGAPIPRKAYFFARSDVFRPRLWGWFLKQLHSIPIERDEPSLSSIKAVLTLLRSGEIVVMFPEGTRISGRRLGEAKGGLGMMVAKSAVPVIPAYISGAASALPKKAKMIRLKKIKIIYGRPLYLTPLLEGTCRRDGFQRISDRVMTEIGALKKRLEG